MVPRPVPTPVPTPALFPLLASNNAVTPDPLALNLQIGLMVTAAVNAAVNLHLAEHLEQEPKTVEMLAQETHTHAPSLLLLMRALSSIGIFVELERSQQLFANSERSRQLLPKAMAPLVRLWGADYQWESWRDLSYTIQTGKPALAKQHGEDATVWTYLDAHPEESATFQEGLSVNAGLIIPSLLANYDFSGITSCVDVGGGRGTLARALLHRYPGMHVTVLDRESVIEQARRDMMQYTLQEPQLSRQYIFHLKLVAGDFFVQVPGGGQCYLLKNVLMDWSNEQYVQIVTSIRRASAAMSRVRVLIIEPVLDDDTRFTHFFSVQMAMMMHAARHRTLDEHQTLLQQAGFTLTNALPLGLEYMLLEAHRDHLDNSQQEEEAK